MARPKKGQEKIQETKPEAEVVEKIEIPKVAPLTADFGREDLNTLRDKLNEVIATL